MKEVDIRYLIHNEYLSNYKNDKDSKIIDEFNVRLGETRIDIALINGYIHGYEIKSEHDTLARLKFQIESYNKVFDKITIVTSSLHTKKLLKMLPIWWGIIEIDISKNLPQHRIIRNPELNLSIDLTSLLQFLWKDELIKMLSAFIPEIKIKNKPKYILWELALKTLSPEKINQVVRNALKSRNYSISDLLQK